MKKVFYSLAVVALITFSSCSKDEDHNFDQAEQNVALRASSLGYTDVATYEESVTQQCAEGNHENCDIQTNGEHQACTYPEHAGMNHDGTDHNGTDHGMHDANGHSHSSHGSGNHNNGENHTGGHH